MSRLYGSGLWLGLDFDIHSTTRIHSPSPRAPGSLECSTSDFQSPTLEPISRPLLLEQGNASIRPIGAILVCIRSTAPAPAAIAAAMAVARPVRVLGLAAVMMWCFFLYQVFKPGSSIKAPLGIPNNERDPLLDRELQLDPVRPSANPARLLTDSCYPPQLPASQKEFSAAPAPDMLPTRKIRSVSTRPY